MIAVTSQELAKKIAPAASLLKLPVLYKNSLTDLVACNPQVIIGEPGEPAQLNLLYALRKDNPAILRILAFSGVAIPFSVMASLRIGHRFVDLSADTQEIAAIISDAVRLSHQLQEEKVRQCVRNLAYLPRLPSLFLEVEEAVHKPGSSLIDASRIIERDPTVTSQVLKLVNAAAFSGMKPVTKISEAVTRIGINHLKALILGVSVFSDRIRVGNTLDFRTLHAHAFTVARCCRALAELEGLPGWSQDMLFLAGLLHDLGSLVLLTSNPTLYEETLLRAQNEGREMAALEADVFGTDHAVLGGYVSRLWGFPDMVSELIMFHNDAVKEDVSFAILRSADAMAQKVLYGGAGEGIKAPGTIPQAWRKIYERIVRESP